MSIETRRKLGEYVAVLEFDAEELRGIAAALSPDDIGGAEMEAAAAELDRLNGWDE